MPSFTLEQEKKRLRREKERRGPKDKGKDLSGSQHPALPSALSDHPLTFLIVPSFTSRILASSSRSFLFSTHIQNSHGRGVLVLRDLVSRVGESYTRISSSDRFTFIYRMQFDKSIIYLIYSSFHKYLEFFILLNGFIFILLEILCNRVSINIFIFFRLFTF